MKVLISIVVLIALTVLDIFVAGFALSLHNNFSNGVGGWLFTAIHVILTVSLFLAHRKFGKIKAESPLGLVIVYYVLYFIALFVFVWFTMAIFSVVTT